MLILSGGRKGRAGSLSVLLAVLPKTRFFQQRSEPFGSLHGMVEQGEQLTWLILMKL